MSRILIVGGASYDLLHLADCSVHAAGGAGLYTALAAARSGAATTMVGFRPQPLPDYLQPAAARLSAWLGPTIDPSQLARFEISYGDGRTTYLDCFFGAEGEPRPPLVVPDMATYDLVHVTPVGLPGQQLAYVHACREQGAQRLSAGTYPAMPLDRPQEMQAIFDLADIFFMNVREARRFFGALEAARTAPGKLLFVTLGAQGACVIQGATCSMIPAVPAAQIDPTGAGDTFCGATITHLAAGRHPLMAAAQATALAGEMIGAVGGSALLSDDPAPPVPSDDRVQINERQIDRVAGLLQESDVAPFAFTGDAYPPPDHARALDFFFAATLQQFGFWSTQNGRYDAPLFAPIGGVMRKGSDYLWYAYLRAIEREPEFCSPARQAALTRADMLHLFRSDSGADPMPALDLHWQQAQQYGRDMLALGHTPQSLLRAARASAAPLKTFLSLLDHVGGYKEDPLRKKSSLLAMILAQRPERFLPLRPDEQTDPVIDYHLMRSALRVGLIDVCDEQLAQRLEARRTLSPAAEWSVRHTAYRAIDLLHARSGVSAAAIDWLFFNARRRCPEMTEPECAACPLDPVCAHRKALFQPVLRTTFY